MADRLAGPRSALPAPHFSGGGIFGGGPCQGAVKGVEDWPAGSCLARSVHLSRKSLGSRLTGRHCGIPRNDEGWPTPHCETTDHWHSTSRQPDKGEAPSLGSPASLAQKPPILALGRLRPYAIPLESGSSSIFHSSVSEFLITHHLVSVAAFNAGMPCDAPLRSRRL